MSGFDIERSVSTKYNLPNTMFAKYIVSVDDIYILDDKNDIVGVLIDEYDELQRVYLELKSKFIEYEDMLVELGKVEKEYTKEELEEIQKEQDRKALLETQKNVEDLTALVAQLVEINKTDKEKIKELENNKPLPPNNGNYNKNNNHKNNNGGEK